VYFLLPEAEPSRKNGFALKAAELNVIIFYGHIFRTRTGHVHPKCMKNIFLLKGTLKPAAVAAAAATAGA